MIIESHAHYSHPKFDGTFRYLGMDDYGLCIAQGGREDILEQMERAGVVCSVEPGIDLASNERAIRLSEQYPGRIIPAIGLHPTRTWYEKWKDRTKLEGWAAHADAAAIGETGLDYHYRRSEQHRLCQMIWFVYQIRLARRMQLPMILHIRQADRDAISILRLYNGRNGGVVHCFNGDWKTASRYIELGYHIGIGAALLQPEERAAKLWEAVRKMPLERILAETDAPYVLPSSDGRVTKKELRKARNTSLILPLVIRKIAQLKGISEEAVEKATAENAVRLFSLGLPDRDDTDA